MTMFPQLSDTYYVDNDHNILKMMDYVYAKNIQINQSYWSEADIDNRFKAGDQSLYNDIYGNMPAFRKKQFNFNRIRRIINMITGYQRQHRKSTVVTPIEGSDEFTSEQFTKLLFHVNTKGYILNTISEAFEGAITSGMNLLSVWMDYRFDPVNGDIRCDNLSYNGFLIDPYFKNMDLSDCNNIWVRKYVSREMAKSLLPGREDEIVNMRGWGNRDGKFQFEPESFNYGMQDLLIYDEFWYLSSRKQKMLADVITGECMEWRGSDEDLTDYLALYPQIVVLNQEIPTVKLAIVVQGKVFYHGENPLGIDRYPFVPVWAYYQPEIPYFPQRIQGVVRGLRDAQYLYNRRRIIELDILESQVNSGFIFKEGAPVNPKDMLNVTGQGRAIPIKDNYDVNADIRRIEPPQVPPSMIQLSELLGQEIQQISGVSDELLGMADGDQAGILSMLRQGAGLITLQKLFDNLDFAQKLLGDITISLIQSNWTPGKVQRIINEEPSQQFYNRAFGKYDAVVEEGLNTSTQKQMAFTQLYTLWKDGVPIPMKTLLDHLQIQDKQQLIEDIESDQEAQAQAMQQQQSIQIEVLKAQIKDLEAKAMANEGLGYERASRIAENNALAVERIAQAQHERDLGAVERIKAVKELEDIDMNNLAKKISVIQLIQESLQEEAIMRAQEATPQVNMMPHAEMRNQGSL